MQELTGVVVSSPEWGILGLSVLLIVFMCVVAWRRRRRKQQETKHETYLSKVREVTMTVEGRRLYVDKVFYERMCDSTIDAVLNGEITEDEANNLMARLAQALKQEKEFEPIFRSKKPALVKAKLKASQRRRDVSTLNGRRPIKKAPIPEPVEEKPTLASILS